MKPEPCNAECGNLAQVPTPAGPLCRSCAAKLARGLEASQ